MPGASTSYAPSVSYVASGRLQARRALLHQEAPWCPPSQPQQRPASRRRGAPAQAAEGTLLGGVTAPAARQLRIPVGNREVSDGRGRRRGLVEALVCSPAPGQLSLVLARRPEDPSHCCRCLLPARRSF